MISLLIFKCLENRRGIRWIPLNLSLEIEIFCNDFLSSLFFWSISIAESFGLIWTPLNTRERSNRLNLVFSIETWRFSTFWSSNIWTTFCEITLEMTRLPKSSMNAKERTIPIAILCFLLNDIDRVKGFSNNLYWVNI